MSDEIVVQIAQGEILSDELELYVGRTYAVDSAIAAYAGTPPNLLHKLAKSADKNTRRNVVCNAMTPAKLLVYLASEFPLEFFSHPLLNFNILEDPDFLTQLEPGVMKAFLNDPACPDAFIKWACHYGYKTDHLTILKRKNLTVEHLVIIAHGRHPLTSERAIDRLIELGESW